MSGGSGVVRLIERLRTGVPIDDTDREDVTRLVENEARYRMFMDHAGDALFVHGKDACVLEVNHQACASLGFTRDELIGQHPTLFDDVIQESKLEELQRRLNEGETVTFESFHTRKDGTRFPVEIRIRAMQGGERLAIVRDISERRRLEDRLRHNHKMEAIGRLAGGVAHDFNNLLTIISTVSEELQDDLPVSSRHHELVATIIDAGERAASLTAQLLAFGRQTMIAPKVLDLNQAIVHLVRMLRRTLGGDDVIVTLDALEPSLAEIEVDPGHIDQVLLNLLLNARDAMPGGGEIKIQTSNRVLSEPSEMSDEANNLPRTIAAGAYVELSITDTGEGISEEDQAHIFEPFFTTKGALRGTGLGLATVYGIVEQARGLTMVTSTRGQGATFTVLFPAATTRRTSILASGNKIPQP